ncbi:MAG: zinc ribbon domain-containing protein, partial [Nitrososphaeraceae archaeon]|nr:zinc ribbon domain-containing protein [Nitrososphaeraceae archaeon]
DSLPYVKEYLTSKSEAEYSTNITNPDSWIFISTGNNHHSKLTYDGLATRYAYYKKKYFPSLLNDETIPEPDKSWIRNLLTKPWNLYILRHSSLTEKSQFLTEAVLRSHAGWSMSSKMPQVYIHLNNESSKILLEKRGIINTKDRDISNVLKSRECPNCHEPNKPESRFCMKCKMILSYDTYNENVNNQIQKDKQISELNQKYEDLNEKINQMFELIQENPKLSYIKPNVLDELI